jgi:hypothetical protein
MPVDARCKLVYLAGAAKRGERSIPHAVFRHLWPDTAAPSNSTELAKALGVARSTLRGWYAKMPADRRDQLAKTYGVTSDLRRSWDEDACQKFKERYERYERYWRTIL